MLCLFTESADQGGPTDQHFSRERAGEQTDEQQPEGQAAGQAERQIEGQLIVVLHGAACSNDVIQLHIDETREAAQQDCHQVNTVQSAEACHQLNAD